MVLGCLIILYLTFGYLDLLETQPTTASRIFVRGICFFSSKLFIHLQVVPSLSRLHGGNRASPGSESGMGKRAAKPHPAAVAVLRGS